MTSRDFCFWLQGFIELSACQNAQDPSFSAAQMASIRKHPALVFKHEIDPSMGDAAHQQALNAAHSPNSSTFVQVLSRG